MSNKLISRFLLFFATLLLSFNAFSFESGVSGTISTSELPVEARETLRLIRQGGPFPYEKDGSVFGNYERVLPQQKRGYYREFTVKTPRARNRGARRLVTGGAPRSTAEIYYTADHYRSFRRVIEQEYRR
ncbi:ribonuclease domain-containing protein [Oxalicibacterium flavum]|uniref:ribonuclease domain-containing protein n=1 Tax=Oxalicibacterium flavum TaxID=179467 RepID=UPI0016668F7E|nr:ribonuclease domain-containing protein [Oxalicibacterium flavum]